MERTSDVQARVLEYLNLPHVGWKLYRGFTPPICWLQPRNKNTQRLLVNLQTFWAIQKRGWIFTFDPDARPVVYKISDKGKKALKAKGLRNEWDE